MIWKKPIFDLGFLASGDGIIKMFEIADMDIFIINLYSYSPNVLRFKKINSNATRSIIERFFSIAGVTLFVSVAKVIPGVVCNFLIDMINYVWPVTSHVKPNQAVNEETLAINSTYTITSCIRSSCFLSRVFFIPHCKGTLSFKMIARAFTPTEFTSLGIVRKAFFKIRLGKHISLRDRLMCNGAGSLRYLSSYNTV